MQQIIDKYSTFGNMLRALRRQANLTQPQASELMGITQPYLSKLESDQVIPSVDLIKKIAGVFNMSMEHLLLGIEMDWLEKNFHDIPNLSAMLFQFNKFQKLVRHYWISLSIVLLLIGIIVFIVGQFSLLFPEKIYSYLGTYTHETTFRDSNNINWDRSASLAETFFSYKDLGNNIQRPSSIFPKRHIIFYYDPTFKLESVDRKINDIFCVIGIALALLGLLAFAFEKQLNIT